ncbi:MAG: hypothetical protein Q8L79_07715 [Methylobacter sp.]|uniref:hypothetical protein n=1 Tax=Methylobacter sp. TaxID=2051955 RepID=UPI0027319DDB|nr:hypothetical protein [Methylobacter sp.]MDP1665000.1 hypothetical protein [Methylobacter sp.]
MNKFLMIDEAALLSGMPVRRLLQLGMRGELSIYAQGDWFWCSMEEPYQGHNIRVPIYLNDTNQIGMLARGEKFQLHVDSDGRFISRRDCDDDNEYLDGVAVGEINLYCLKSEIEEIKGCATSKTLDPNQQIGEVSDMGTGTQDSAEPAGVKGKTSKPRRQKGGQDKLRAEHFMARLKQDENIINKSHKLIDDDLRNERPDLWGKNIETLNTWFKSDEGKEVKKQLNTLKLDARRAGEITEKQETGL